MALRTCSYILPKVFKRHVNDIFVIFLCQSHLNDFVHYMKTKHANIKLQNLRKMNLSFSFLNVKITRSNNQLVTSIFHKATFTGAFTNFKSFFPVAHKFGVVYTLLHRYFSICFSYGKFYEEIVLLKYIFKKNEYPEFFIDRFIKNYLRSSLFPKRSFTLLAKTNLLSFTFFRFFIS